MKKDTSVLNGVRAFSALWVVTAHCVIWGGAVGIIPMPSPKIAVDAFIVLSGFLMSFTVAARESHEPMRLAENWFRFYARRFFRLAPAYYLSLILVVLFASSFLDGYSQLRELRPEQWRNDVTYDPKNVVFDAQNLLLHFSFLFGLFPSYSFSTFLPDWSIGLEMQFYIAFPAVILAMRRFGVGKTAIVLALLSYAIVLGIKVAVSMGLMSAYREPSLLFYRLPIFMSGMLIFEAMNGHATNRFRYVLLALGLCAPMVWSYRLSVLLLLALVALMACAVVWDEAEIPQLGWLRKLCRTKIVNLMSDLSYSVYLFHGLFLSIVGSRVAYAAKSAGISVGPRTILMWLVVIFLTYLFAYFAYRLIELPGIRLAARLLQRNRGQAVSA